MTSDLHPLVVFIETTLCGDFVGFAPHSFLVQRHCRKYITYIYVLTTDKNSVPTVLCHEKLNLEVNVYVTHHSRYYKTLFPPNDSEAVMVKKKLHNVAFKSNHGMFNGALFFDRIKTIHKQAPIHIT